MINDEVFVTKIMLNRDDIRPKGDLDFALQMHIMLNFSKQNEVCVKNDKHNDF